LRLDPDAKAFQLRGMIAELGQFALVLALFVALAQAAMIFVGMRARDPFVHTLSRTGAIAQCALVALSFGLLLWLFATSDFSVALVEANSHTSKPFLYKLTAAWGNHEGSMLLWILILSAYTAALAFAAPRLERQLASMTIAVQSAVTSTFLAFLIFTSNPFARLSPPSTDGQGFNALLQDPGLATHPPLLYAGYVGFSIVFSFACAALILGRADAAWARIVRPWALTAWIFLTVGIAMGSNWAYYELGWGGWWAWDPVENASLMPWLAGTALIHSLRVMEKRDTLKSWTILLALMTFSLSLVGTFLVRSGVITSVHSFAVDPTRGVFILGILGLSIGGALSLFAWRAAQLRPGGSFKPISRESALLINNVVLAAATALVLVGTFYELFVRVAGGERLTVQAPYYNATFNPMVGALIVLLPVSTLLAWKRGRLEPALRRLLLPAVAALLTGLGAWLFIQTGSIPGALGMALGVWTIAGSFADLGQRVRAFEIPIKASLDRLPRLPASQIGMSVAHIGLGVLILGITGVSAYKSEQTRLMEPGDTVVFAGYDITLDRLDQLIEDNYIADRATFTVGAPGGVAEALTGERRFYGVEGMGTTEAAIRGRFMGDLYLSVGPAEPSGRRQIDLFYYPLAAWLWLGAGLMSLGGALSLADGTRRRLTARNKARIEGEAV
jgi:cytochrome c-type biogenesis protein CcmF